ncbi:MAG: YlxR family protein [Erysipelothrix sp.]|nr:YlxR family protein [Erysipelothrix sp.]
MARKIPLRKCIATGEQLPKQELLRIVKTPENKIVIDPTGKKNGRGAYIKKSIEALNIAKDKGLLKRALGVDIPDEVYESIRDYLS